MARIAINKQEVIDATGTDASAIPDTAPEGMMFASDMPPMPAQVAAFMVQELLGIHGDLLTLEERGDGQGAHGGWHVFVPSEFDYVVRALWAFAAAKARAARETEFLRRPSPSGRPN